ncbi:ATP-binding protein [Sulfurospirillum diekertiae]|uniref:histidine kinase n=1 Tax=Sulfurospirillum diekertiae TaxID=1854492 RepID=A0A6G9VVB3_9BACT|nr:ATP-binding protein [Sulfurospirillum diekertiae]QIR76946.1 ATP-binding protein [Sulfurospirillum diekertiae]QIR79563.1 ATP-binding protein [Sulfurospirillum diekertiae]
MQQLNEQLLITFECVSAIGTSLQLTEMMEHFLKVFSRKTGALASIYWEYDKHTQKHKQICFYGKKAFQDLLVLPSSLTQYDTITFNETNGKYLLHVKIMDDWIVFIFDATKAEMDLIQEIISLFQAKLENAVCACKNHLELIEINQTLERRIEEEVAKNREKDKHILQQSRLAQMGEMISMIAHQWRQPLGSISTVAASIKLKIMLNRFDYSTIEGQEASKAFLEEAMSKIESYVQFLTRTIDDFRNFFKPNKQKESITLSQLINRTLEIIGKALEINGITINIQTHATTEIFTYANEVTQVILNILKNAEDVIKEREIINPNIQITIGTEDAWQTISITDNAGGIPATVLPHIFEPYFSTKQEKNGTGLGLYMSKTIIEEHCGGQILATNTPTGAQFTIKLKEG